MFQRELPKQSWQNNPCAEAGHTANRLVAEPVSEHGQG